MKLQRQITAIFFPTVFLALFTWNASVYGQRIEGESALQDFETLASDEFLGRGSGAEGAQIAREYLVSRLQEMGVAPLYQDYFHTFTARNRNEGKFDAINVVGLIPGTESEDVLVLSAHYDHLGVRGDLIFNGADDNASGVAAVLALAEYFVVHPPKHAIAITFFDAEELGLQGSKALANDLLEDHTVLFNLNLDMVSRSDKGEIFAAGSYQTPQLKDWLSSLRAEDQWDVNIRFGHDRPRSHRQDWTYSSDHGSFFRKGVPFLYFGVEDHPDYHQHTDTFEKVNPEFYMSVLEVILEAALQIDAHVDELQEE